MVSFQHSEAFWALMVIPFLLGLYLLDRQRRKKLILALGNPRQIQKLAGNYSSRNDWYKFLFPLVAIAWMILSWAGPRKTGKSNMALHKGVDVMIAWDLSKSMYAEDIQPSRLELSRQLVYSLIEALPSDRIGLVFFAGHAYLQMPLSMDHGVARLYVQQASPEQLPTQGTVIGEALAMCSNAFVKEERKHKSIILISDGEGHDEKSSEWITALNESGIVVHTVGVGSSIGAPIPDKASGSLKKDAQGNTIQTRFNPSTLQTVAKGTQGLYLELKNTDQVIGQIKSELSRMEKKQGADPSMANYVEYFQWFIASAIVCILIGFFWPEHRSMHTT